MLYNFYTMFWRTSHKTLVSQKTTLNMKQTFIFAIISILSDWLY